MKLKILLLLLFILPTAASAHRHHGGSEVQTETCTSAPDNNPSQTDREKWYKEARELKHQFLIKELGLKQSQQKPFFEAYDRLQEETHNIHRQTRQMEKRVYELGDKATELDYEKATDALYEEKQKEAEMEMRYRQEFKKILTPAQQFKLKGAERKFTKELMEHHRRTKK